METVSSVVGLLFLIGIAIGYRALSRPPRYRIRLVDPATNIIKYVTAVDGIHGSISYSSDPDRALLFRTLGSAEQAMEIQVSKHKGNPIIEVRNRLFGWKPWVGQGA